jgi:hypothetical protein
VELSAHDDFEQNIARIERYFHPRFHFNVFFIQLVRNLVWPLSFLYTHLLYPIVKCTTTCTGTTCTPGSGGDGSSVINSFRGNWFWTPLRLELGLVRLAVFTFMFFGLAQWLENCHSSLKYCKANSRCSIPSATVFMPFALAALRAVYRAASEAFFRPLKVVSSRKLQEPSRWQTEKKFIKHKQDEYHQGAERHLKTRRASSMADHPVSSQVPLLQGHGTGAQAGDVQPPTFIVVLTVEMIADEVDLDQRKLPSNDLEKAWTSYCCRWHKPDGTGPPENMWLMDPPDEITGEFTAGIPLKLSKPEVFKARQLGPEELRRANSARFEDSEQHNPCFRHSFIPHSIYKVNDPGSSDGSPCWCCTHEVDSAPAKSSEVTVDMLLTHQLEYIKDEKGGFVRLTEQPVSEYAQSPRYIYCHTIAKAADESKLKAFQRLWVAPCAGLIHGFIPAIHPNRFTGGADHDDMKPATWVVFVLSGLAGAYWVYQIVYDLIKAFALYLERKHVQLAISMLYDAGKVDTEVDPRYRELQKDLAMHIELADREETAQKEVEIDGGGGEQAGANDSAGGKSEELKWQFHFNASAHGRVDLRSWYLVRRTMSVLSEVRSQGINVFLFILLATDFVALVFTIVVGINFGFDVAFDDEFGAQVAFLTLVLAGYTVLIFRQGQIANDRQARDKVQLAFQQYDIVSDLSCSAKYRNPIDNKLTHEGEHRELLAAALGSTISCMGLKDTPLTLLGFPLTFQSLSVFSGGIVSIVFAVVGTQLPDDFLEC